MIDLVFSFFENDFLAVFPEIFFLTALLILLFFGVSTENSSESSALIQTLSSLSLFSLLCTFVLIVHNPIHQALVFSQSLILDDFSYYFKLLLLLGCAGSLVISQKYFVQEKIYAFEYVLFLLFSTLSMLFMISSYDFISLFLTIEFQTLCFYVLAAAKRNSEFSTEAGVKYFLLGAFSSGILLFGCSLIYGFTGMTNFGELSLLLTGLGDLNFQANQWEEFRGNTHVFGILLGILFLTVGFLFKVTAAPFHMWAPDVYEGSPTSTTAFFSIVPKIALFAVFARVFFGSFYDLLFSWQKILLLCSAVSMIVGSFAALSQHKIKRLLAYSSIGHVGYMLLGLSCASLEGIEAVFIYLVIYVMMSLNVFGILLGLGSAQFRLKYISDFSILAKTQPVLAFSFACILFSMAGIPPLAGFCSKFYIFFAALGSGFYALAILGVLTSVVSCFYYIRLIKIMYFEKPTQYTTYESMDAAQALVIACTFFFVVFFFFYPSPVFFIAHKVALCLSI
jgi:proton-translocating NADH-quinone oxidoreductase chain N